MQNDYCAPGGMAHRAGADLSGYAEIVPRIAAFARACRALGVPVVHVRMVSLPGGGSDSAAWLRLRLRSNSQFAEGSGGSLESVVLGSWGAEFVDGLRPEEGEPVVAKFRSSGFYETPLDLVLRGLGAETLLFAGCTTEGCVESTVRDAGYRDYFPVVLSDCVASGSRALHEASLLVMSAYRADVTTSDAVLAAWAAAAPAGAGLASGGSG
jgi:nicotinamidase-related amidase